jgi:cation-transporting P-type ATPase C
VNKPLGRITTQGLGKRRMRGDPTVLHSIAGRLRIRVPRVQGRAEIATWLRDSLRTAPGVRMADVRVTTGSLILLYDPRILTPGRLMEMVLESVRALSVKEKAHTPGSVSSPHAHGSVFPRRVWAAAWGQLGGIGALSLFLGYALVRRFLFRSPVSQAPLSLAGVVASLGALPLTRRAILDLRAGRRLGLFPFLAGACGLAIAMGEALTAVEILWVLSIGMFLEERAAERARRGIREILEVAPQNVLLLVEGTEVEVPARQLVPGHVVAVTSWRTIPCDGKILEGEALVDESRITGRSQPELRRAGERVHAGTTVQEGYLRVLAERLGEETYLSRMAQLVERSLEDRGEMEKRADILAARLSRMGLAATAGTMLLTGSLSRAFSVLLVISCPCATVLAASTAIAAAVANAARRHILIKGGIHLEWMAQADALCLDKTGTVTDTSSSVLEILGCTQKESGSELLRMAACAETGSQHPLARAILAEAKARGIESPTPCEREVHLGRGVSARCEGELVLVGSESFMKTNGLSSSRFRKAAQAHLGRGHTVLFVARHRKLLGMIALANPVRAGAREALAGLRKEGISYVALLSGDAQPIVQGIAEDLGLDEYGAELLPEQKARFVEALTASGRKVVMVGDGVNDALALSRASVGVAMGAGGSEVAVEASDIALAEDDLRGLLYLRRLSRRTLETVEQNFWIANFTNMAGIILGASGLFPPVLAGLLHVAHTLGIMLNSSRLLHWEGSAKPH